MKKLLLLTAFLIFVMLLAVSCVVQDETSEESQKAVSETDSSALAVSDTETSVIDNTSEEASKAETSEVSEEVSDEVSEEVSDEVSEEKYIFTQEDIDKQWEQELKAESEKKLIYNYNVSYKHIDAYHMALMFGPFVEEIFPSRQKYNDLWNSVLDVAPSIAHIVDYFDIPRETYEEAIEKYFVDYSGGQPYQGYCPGASYYLILTRYDAIYSEEYWDHPDFIRLDYVAPEVKNHYTSVPEDKEHIRLYYLIDGPLIEFVGVDNFNKWLDETPDNEQNIINFVSDFNITRKQYEDIYEELRKNAGIGLLVLPYNCDSLFGTQEMQDFFFKKHPLE